MSVGEVPVKGQITQMTEQSGCSTKRKLLYALLAALVVVVVVAVPVTVTQFTVHRRSSTRGSSVVSTSGSGSVLSGDYCSKLYGDAKTYCKSYLKSTGPNKFMAASIWLQVSQATRKHAFLYNGAPVGSGLYGLGVPFTAWPGIGERGEGRCAVALTDTLLLCLPCPVPCRRVCWA